MNSNLISTIIKIILKRRFEFVLIWAHGSGEHTVEAPGRRGPIKSRQLRSREEGKRKGYHPCISFKGIPLKIRSPDGSANSQEQHKLMIEPLTLKIQTTARKSNA